MSHLTAPMPPQAGHSAHKPYLLDLPRPVHPLTPPETDYEAISHYALPAQNTTGLETEPLHSHVPPTMLDSPYASPYATLHRKRPSVTYVNSGIREARERVVQRGLKWLVVVLPPVSFTREHGHLGNTLSSGPSRRLSNGLLMPLYPTLSSQLGAIAREFSFPSISGLCVYLHTNHGGISLTPRVSDESWPLLWNHLFDARSPSLPVQQLPISGQIEFDIDLTKARWYESWIASSRRDYVDVPQSVAPSRPQSLSHWRADSQTSVNEPVDDQMDVISLAAQNTAKGRNIKKLSLLDRFDPVSVRSGSKLVPRDESPPSQSASVNITMQALSPIVQEDEPLTAKRDFDSRLNSWRIIATASARSPLAATGQTSLDPANMPNTMEDLPTASASDSELNLDDYTWSVSSVGPPDYDMESIYSWDRVPSVHMDRRGEGSVCLTPSVCTSFGPDDDYFHLSPVSYTSRLPSPDLAWRMLEDVPPTPTTATSWGPPLSFPPSPMASSYAPSIDIGGRYLLSRPVTPTTATSWGAPLSLPPSPVMLTRPPSPDLGERVASSVPSSPRYRRPNHYGRTFELVVPYYDVTQRQAEEPQQAAEPSHYGSTFEFVVPYYDATQPHVEAPQQAVTHTHYDRTFEFVVPYYDMTPPYAETPQQEQAGRLDNFIFPPPAEAKQNSMAREASGVTLGYPVFDIYPAVYPSLEIYPAVSTVDQGKLDVPAISFNASYPAFDLYPAVYPTFDIYPAIVTVAVTEAHKLSTRIPTSYPTIEPYPDAYPYLTIYPTVPNDSGAVATANTLDDSVSVISVQPSSGYLVLENSRVGYPHSLHEIYPAVKASTVSTSFPVSTEAQLRTSYPTFNIYPAVYPYSLAEIYPSVIMEEIRSIQFSAVSVGVECQYPIFDIYPSTSGQKVYQVPQEVVVSLQATDPRFNIRLAGYPWNVYELYPSTCHDGKMAGNYGISVKLAVQYPVLDIYPPEYPHNLEAIYPRILPFSVIRAESVRVVTQQLAPLSVKLPAAYPDICPYPPAYPYLDIYPSASVGDLSTLDVELEGKERSVSKYPHLVIYPAVYPFIEIYPSYWDHSVSQLMSRHIENKRRKHKFSHMELRAQVLATGQVSSPPARRIRPKYSHMELHAQVVAEAQASIPPPSRTIPLELVAAPVARTALPDPRVLSPISRSLSPVPRSLSPVPRTVSPVRRAMSPKRRSLSPVPKDAPPVPPLPPSVLVPVPIRGIIPVPAPSVSVPLPRSRPAEMDLQKASHEEHMEVPTIVAIEPSPTAPDVSPASPVLFEMVTAPTPSPSPPHSVAPTLVRSRSRSGTVNTRPAASPVPVARSISGRPLSLAQPPPTSELPPVPSPPRLVNRLSGLPAHPAVNRRVSSAIPRPMSTFGPLPAVPQGQSAPSPTRRQTNVMSTLAEEPSPMKTRSPQLPSPPEEWQRGWRTPTEGTSPVSPLVGAKSDLSRSKTMPTRTAPRGPRSSTMISERARLFDNPNVSPSEDGPLKLSMSTLSEFPAPPMPSLTSVSSPNSMSRNVSKLDRSKYPFA